MDPDDEGFLGVPSGILLAGGIAIVAALVFFFPQRISSPPAPPSYLGCYSARGAPNILIDRRYLHARQPSPIDEPYALEYHKGWGISIERWMNFVRRPDGRIEIVRGPDVGEILSLSREEEVASRVPGFDLIDRQTSTSIHYARTGADCES